VKLTIAAIDGLTKATAPATAIAFRTVFLMFVPLLSRALVSLFLPNTTADHVFRAWSVNPGDGSWPRRIGCRLAVLMVVDFAALDKLR
jgi:hypothetical protein